MTDLLTRLSSLDGPDREVDAEIALRVGRYALSSNREAIYSIEEDGQSRFVVGRTSGKFSEEEAVLSVASLPSLPRYTGSTDAALTLPGAEDNLREAIYLAAEVRGPHGKKLGEELARELCRICIVAIEATMTDLDTALPCECPVSTCPELIDHYSACPAYYRPAVEKLREADKARIAELERDQRQLDSILGCLGIADSDIDPVSQIDAIIQRAEAAEARAEKLADLVQTLIDNDPNDMAADAVTVLDVWRKEARAALQEAAPCGTCGGDKRVPDETERGSTDFAPDYLVPCPDCGEKP